MRAIQALRYGGSDTLAERELPLPTPGAGEVRVRVEAAGVNFIDIYRRTGLYPTQEPVRLGLEGAGIVEELGAGVTDLAPGERVAWSDVAGSYASHVCAPRAHLVKVPAALDGAQAAAAMLQGMTAHYLTHDTYRLQRDDTCVVHAAAGGVGLLLCQMAARLGAQVVAVVSSDEKAERARKAGARHVLVTRTASDLSAVRELTGGRGAQVVYDSVGRDTWQASLAALAPRGMLVLFGQSSGPVPAFDPQLLARGGSLYLTRPTLGHYVSTPDELQRRASALFDMLLQGQLTLTIDQRFPLANAAAAHDRLESRASIGKLLLVP
jgi:NADPH2:quinone reductase